MPLAHLEWSSLLVTTLLVIALLQEGVKGETFTLGYITGSKRRPNDFEYQRPGYRISGAITLAVEEVRKSDYYTYEYSPPQAIILSPPLLLYTTQKIP